MEDNRPGRVLTPDGSARADGKPTPLTPGALADAQALIADELLVEEVSIDGMCGVY